MKTQPTAKFYVTGWGLCLALLSSLSPYPATAPSRPFALNVWMVARKVTQITTFMKHYLVFGLVIALMVIQGVAGRGMIRVNENENGKTIYLKIGDTLEVFLEGNPTTGYAWDVDQLDPAILKRGESDFIPAVGGLGSACTEVLRFEAIAAGGAVLKLHYKRSFEKGITPLRYFRLWVVVKPS